MTTLSALSYISSISAPICTADAGCVIVIQSYVINGILLPSLENNSIRKSIMLLFFNYNTKILLFINIIRNGKITKRMTIEAWTGHLIYTNILILMEVQSVGKSLTFSQSRVGCQDCFICIYNSISCCQCEFISSMISKKKTPYLSVECQPLS